MNTRDRLLLNTPPALQSLLVTLGSGLRAGNRYGRGFRIALAALEGNEALGREDLSNMLRTKLHDVLANAKQHVPHYRSLQSTADDLSTWLVLDKQAIREDPDAFLSGKYRRSELTRSETSGTSGSPLSVFLTSEAYQWEMAFRWRHRAWAGVPFGARGAYFSGHLVAPPARKEPPFWVHDVAEQRLLFSSYHMSDRTLPAYIARLTRFDPEFVHGYPSSLFLVAQAVLQSASRPRPRAVFAASETLQPHQREVIEQAFGCKVYVWYGQTEMTCNIVECPEGSLHVREDYGLLERLPDGTVLGTGLRNPAMPLIRYRLGDEIEPMDGGCRCGREFSLVRSITGRVEDYIVKPDGTKVGRLDHLFKGAPGVAEAQIVQESPDTVRLRVVRGSGYSESTEAAILREGAARLGPTVRIILECVPSIPRGPNGKFRFVIGLPAGTFPGASANLARATQESDLPDAIASREAPKP